MANQYGLTSITFGTPTVSGYVVQSNTVSTKPAVAVEVTNELGQRVYVNYDDVTSEVSFEAVFQGASLPTAGGTFTVDTVTYEVLSVDVKRENKGVKTVSIKGKTSANVSLP